jgi:ADP-heptose:LPS heptosyltransferase
VTDTTDQRALVLFPGALGDFVCFLPALRRLAEATSVDLFARSGFADLAPESVRVSPLERYEINRLFVCGAGAEERLRAFISRYAAVYSWMGSGQRQFVRQLQDLCQGQAQIFPFQPELPGRHQSEYYLTCIHCSDSPVPQISLKPQAVARSAAYWAQHSLEGFPVLVVAPGSGAREKNWPLPSFAAVIGWWRDQIGGKTVVVLGPAEEERGGLEPILLPGCTVARGLTLAELAAILARSDLYLGNDSGVTHMAAALGIPTVALFGPSDAQKWRPQGKRVRILKHEIECAPCSVAAMKSCGHRSCLGALKPAEVIGQLRALLEQRRLDKGGGRD